MARIRSFHPPRLTDPRWVSCGFSARVFLMGLETDADDQGVFEWNALQLKMRILPADNVSVDEMLAELVAAGLIASFEHRGQRYGAIRDFRKFQRPKKPNAVHPLPPEWRIYVGLDSDGSEPETSQPDPVGNQFPTGGENPPQMEDGGEDVGEGKKEAIASSVGSTEPTPTVDPWLKDADFAKAWDACTEDGRKRSSRKKAWPEWRAALKRVPGPVLAAAVSRYVANDEDAKRTGGPGLHVWLKDARYEHWTTGAAETEPKPTFDGPPTLRAAIVRETDEEFARRYLDYYCRWRSGDRTILVRAPVIAERLKQDLAAWLEREGVTVAVEAANDARPSDQSEAA